MSFFIEKWIVWIFNCHWELTYLGHVVGVMAHIHKTTNVYGLNCDFYAL